MTGQTEHLLVCSNSGPGPIVDLTTGPRPAAAGGLVPHVLALLAPRGGTWLYRGEGQRTTWTPRKSVVNLQPVSVGSHGAGHYEAVSIQTLLWLFHYLHDAALSPTFDRNLRRAWGDYQKVNAIFARRATESAGPDGTRNITLVNDYHLMLVPGILREFGGRGRIVYSHHVPWCEPAYFGILPADIRLAILGSLLSADVISFHCRRWAVAFAQCCLEYLAADVTATEVEYRGHRTRLVSVPFPLDVSAVEQLAGTPAWHRQRHELDKLLRGRRLLVRVDRLDLWKNHPRGFAAYGELLDGCPDLAQEWCFLSIAAPTRFRSSRHEAYAKICRELVSDLNRRHGPGVVEMLSSTGTDSRAHALASLAHADAVLINPTSDGFNLVAKEAIFVSPSSRVLLSRTAGAHEYLAPAVRTIEPFDVSTTAAALEEALRSDERSAQGLVLREQLHQDTAEAWLQAILEQVGEH